MTAPHHHATTSATVASLIPVLREYQTGSIAEVARLMTEGHKRVLLVSPTGSGKTVIAAEIIRRMRAKGKRCLFLAHARQLIYQASEKLTSIGVGHGVIMAGEQPRASDVQVASLFSLKNRPLPPADLVVIDEADLARADTYGAILAHYENAFILGMTASPWRGDGKGLGYDKVTGEGIFTASTLVATPKELIEQGFLVDYDPYGFEAIDTSGIKTSKATGDYNEKELARRATQTDAGRNLVGDVVAMYQKYAPGKRGVCFAVSVEHSKMFVARFAAAGIKAEHVDCNTKKEDRARMFARARTGETKILCTVGILTRGVDIPALEVCILARSTKSLALYLQMVGRVMRPSPGTGKARAIILDHAGCIMKDGEIAHGLPDQSRDYSLTSDVTRIAKKDEAEDKGPAIIRCRACYAICPAEQEKCHMCGAALARPAPPVTLDMIEGRTILPEEMRARAEAPPRDFKAEQAYLNEQTIRGRRFGWKENAPSVRMKSKFGHWPSKQQTRDANAAADAELGPAVQRQAVHA